MQSSKQGWKFYRKIKGTEIVGEGLWCSAITKM